MIPWELGSTAYVGNYLILINKVNPKGAVRYEIAYSAVVTCPTERYNTLADVWNRLVTHLGRYLR